MQETSLQFFNLTVNEFLPTLVDMDSSNFQKLYPTDIFVTNIILFEYYISPFIEINDTTLNQMYGINRYILKNNIEKGIFNEAIQLFTDKFLILKNSPYTYSPNNIYDKCLSDGLEKNYLDKFNITNKNAMEGAYKVLVQFQNRVFFAITRDTTTSFTFLSCLNENQRETLNQQINEFERFPDMKDGRGIVYWAKQLVFNSNNQDTSNSIIIEESKEIIPDLKKKTDVNFKLVSSNNKIVIVEGGDEVKNSSTEGLDKENAIPGIEKETIQKRSFFQWFRDTIFGNNSSNAKNENKIYKLMDSSSDNNHHKGKEGISKKRVIGVMLILGLTAIGTYACMSYWTND